jgi:hypothetical protein
MKSRLAPLLVVVALAAAPLSLVGSAHASTGWTWTEAYDGKDGVHPTGADGTTAIASLGNGHVLAFGGMYGGDVNAETWEWDGSVWTQLAPTGTVPAARQNAAMASLGNGHVLLFGGTDATGGTVYTDTWEWDGTAWTAPDSAVLPGGVQPRMAENPGGSGPLLVTNAGSSGSLTFEWGASGWTDMAPATTVPGLYQPSLAYDAHDGHVYLFGGYTNDPDVVYQNSMWQWDETAGDWSDVTPPEPALNPDARENAAMGYDATTTDLVLFGGDNAGGDLGDTWLWNGSGWTQPTPSSSPGTRAFAKMVSTPTGTTMYGGYSVADGFLWETWTWGKEPDTTRPFINLSGPQAAFTLANSASVTYSGHDDAGGSGVVSYDVRYEKAAYNATFGAWQYPSGWQGTTAKTQSLALTPGYEYCFSARARDKAGNVSGWARALCTSKPLDDKVLSASSGWARHSDARYYRSTFTSTKTHGARLTRKYVSADQLMVVATKCPTCGSISLKIGSATVKSWSLSASTTQRQVLLAPTAFSLRKGTVTITVTSSGKRVEIDGLGVRRV